MEFDNNKIMALAKAVIEKAEQDSNKITENARALEQKTIHQIKNEAMAKARLDIQKQAEKIELEAKTEITEKSAKAKKQLLELRCEIQHKVEKRLKAKLAEFMRTDGYIDYLKDKAKDIPKKPGLKVLISGSDADSAAAKALFEGASISVDPHIKIGGMLVVDDQSSLIYDITLDKSLALAMQQFLSVAGTDIYI